jgi:hypothetical protein
MGLQISLNPKNSVILNQAGWGGRIRTSECGLQRPVPYRLATPQRFAIRHLTLIIYHFVIYQLAFIPDPLPFPLPTVPNED